MNSDAASDARRVAAVAAGSILAGAAFIVLFVSAFEVRMTYTVRVVTIGGAALGAISGVLGSFAVLRGQSLLGDALSHAALPGVAIAFMLFGRRIDALLAGAAIAGLTGVAFARLVVRMTRIKEDTAHGIVLAGWFAIGIALLAYIQGLPTAAQAGLDSFIFGQAAAMVRADIVTIVVVGGVAVVVALLVWKELKLTVFDPEFAAANGVPVGFINAIQASLFVIAVVVGLQIAGVVLMVGLLVAPGVAARQWCTRLHHMVLLAALFGALAGAIGALSSAVDTDIPTGPMIIVAACAIVTISILAAPGRGVLWRSLARARDRRRFARINVLRDLYHYAFDHPESGGVVPDAFVRGVRPRAARTGLQSLEAEGLIDADGGDVADGWHLTERGLALARADARNRNLWERYRTHRQRLDLASVGDERGRRIETLLDRDAIRALERAEAGDIEEPHVRD